MLSLPDLWIYANDPLLRLSAHNLIADHLAETFFVVAAILPYQWRWLRVPWLLAAVLSAICKRMNETLDYEHSDYPFRFYLDYYSAGRGISGVLHSLKRFCHNFLVYSGRRDSDREIEDKASARLVATLKPGQGFRLGGSDEGSGEGVVVASPTEVRVPPTSMQGCNLMFMGSTTEDAGDASAASGNGWRAWELRISTSPAAARRENPWFGMCLPALFGKGRFFFLTGCFYHGNLSDGSALCQENWGPAFGATPGRPNEDEAEEGGDRDGESCEEGAAALSVDVVQMCVRETTAPASGGVEILFGINGRGLGAAFRLPPRSSRAVIKVKGGFLRYPDSSSSRLAQTLVPVVKVGQCFGRRGEGPSQRFQIRELRQESELWNLGEREAEGGPDPAAGEPLDSPVGHWSFSRGSASASLEIARASARQARFLVRSRLKVDDDDDEGEDEHVSTWRAALEDAATEVFAVSAQTGNAGSGFLLRRASGAWLSMGLVSTLIGLGSRQQRELEAQVHSLLSGQPGLRVLPNVAKLPGPAPMKLPFAGRTLELSLVAGRNGGREEVLVFRGFVPAPQQYSPTTSVRWLG